MPLSTLYLLMHGVLSLAVETSEVRICIDNLKTAMPSLVKDLAEKSQMVQALQETLDLQRYCSGRSDRHRCRSVTTRCRFAMTL